MTREEYDFIGSMNMCDEISNEAYEKIMVHCDILEQEPCKDAISRKAVLEIVRDMHDLARADVLSHTINQIEKLSPINQEPKIGHWLPYVEENGETVKWICSSCRRVKSITKDKTEYCPVCGAKMEE